MATLGEACEDVTEVAPDLLKRAYETFCGQGGRGVACESSDVITKDFLATVVVIVYDRAGMSRVNGWLEIDVSG